MSRHAQDEKRVTAQNYGALQMSQAGGQPGLRDRHASMLRKRRSHFDFSLFFKLTLGGIWRNVNEVVFPTTIRSFPSVIICPLTVIS